MKINEQVKILSKLSQIMHESALGDYESIECIFEFEQFDDSWSAGSRFSFVRNGEKNHQLLKDDTDEVSTLVHDLHDLMKSHTGGDWDSFTLIIDENGKAKTRFNYKE